MADLSGGDNSAETQVGLQLRFLGFCAMLWKYSGQNYVFENREVSTVEVSYKKMWEILIDKDMKKKDLQATARISRASVTKLSKGETDSKYGSSNESM